MLPWLIYLLLQFFRYELLEVTYVTAFDLHFKYYVYRIEIKFLYLKLGSFRKISLGIISSMSQNTSLLCRQNGASLVHWKGGHPRQSAAFNIIPIICSLFIEI